MTPKLQSFFKDYAAYHKTQGNQITHYLGIPMIMVSLLGLLSQWVIFQPATDLNLPADLRLDGAVILLFPGIIRYLTLDWKIGIPFSFIAAGSYFLGRAIPTPMNWILFILGWIFQGIGHAVYEKKSPAFTKNLTHILIGPIWIFSKLVKYR